MKQRHRVTSALWLAAATLSACRQQQPTGAANAFRDALAQQREQQRMIEARYDKSLVARRGWTKAALSFGQDERRTAARDAGSSSAPRPGTSLGVFRLGMTLEEVRARARQVGVHSTGTFGVSEEAWCAQTATGTGSILAPKELNFTGPARGDAIASYSLELTPLHGQLRVGSIQLVHDKVVRIGPDIERDAHNAGDIAPYTPCELTARERRSLASWDRIEELALRDTLGVPELDRMRLPAGVRAALDRWVRSLIVECDGSADCYARHASFDGYWQPGANFVLSYTLSINGEAPHLIAYIVVVVPDGRCLWTGRPVAFADRGLAGKRETADQADRGM